MKKPKLKRIQDHSQCDCHILQRGPHWGLFCRPHNHWIKWLSDREQAILRDLDMPWISDPKQNGTTLQNVPVATFKNTNS